MYYEPNKRLYSALAHLDDDGIRNVVLIVVAYGLLELLSLVILCWALSSKLNFSAPRQLAFLLENQWNGVQLKLMFWVLYMSQASLEHFGLYMFLC